MNIKGTYNWLMLVVCIVVFVTLIVSPSANAAERDYQIANCKGKVEFVLPDRTRIDCLTETHAIEYDFGKKWAEAIGQSLHYAMHTGKRAGIVLIVDPANNGRFEKRLKAVVEHYGMPIDVWTVSK